MNKNLFPSLEIYTFTIQQFTGLTLFFRNFNYFIQNSLNFARTINQLKKY